MKYLTKTLGYRQSIIDPCLFFLDSDNQRDDIEGIIALATDDLLHGGTDKHLSKMEELKQKYTLGKYLGHWEIGGRVTTRNPPV